MSTDRRELILQRLLAIAGTLAERTARNDPSLTGKSQLAIVLWDGDEPEPDEPPGNRRANAPTIVNMTPELRVLREEPAAELGGRLNATRLAVIKAVIDDALPGGTLYQIVGPNGAVRYNGMSTETMPGRSLEGSHGIRFLVRYPLIHSEL